MVRASAIPPEAIRRHPPSSAPRLDRHGHGHERRRFAANVVAVLAFRSGSHRRTTAVIEQA